MNEKIRIRLKAYDHRVLLFLAGTPVSLSLRAATTASVHHTSYFEQTTTLAFMRDRLQVP